MGINTAKYVHYVDLRQNAPPQKYTLSFIVLTPSLRNQSSDKKYEYSNKLRFFLFAIAFCKASSLLFYMQSILAFQKLLPFIPVQQSRRCIGSVNFSILPRISQGATTDQQSYLFFNSATIYIYTYAAAIKYYTVSLIFSCVIIGNVE